MHRTTNTLNVFTCVLCLSTRPRILYAIIFIAIFYSPSFAQNYRYKQYTIEDGLPTNYVYGAIEDEEGYMWVYTEKGLAKFDGYEFKCYGIKDGLQDQDIYHLIRDTFNTIWVRGFLNHPTYLEGDSIVQVKMDDKYRGSLSFNQIDISHVWNGKDFVLNKGELIDSFNRTYLNSIEDYQSSAFVKIDIESSAYYDKGKNLIYEFLKDTIIYHPVKGNWDKYLNFQPLHYNINSQIVIFSFEEGMIGYLLDKKIEKQYSWDALNLEVPQHVIGFEHKDFFYVVTNKFILKINEEFELVETLRFENILDNHILMRFFIDSGGNYWLGTRDAGLFFIAKTARNSNYLDQPFAEDNVFENFLKTEDHLFVISDAGGLYEINEEVVVNKVPPEYNTNNGLFELAENQLLSHGRNYYTYNILTEKSIKNDQSISPILGKAKTIMESNDGSSFYLNAPGGLYSCNKKGVANRIDNRRISNMCNQGENYFFSSNNILFRLNNGSLDTSVIMKSTITSLNGFGNQNLLIGTFEDGLTKYDYISNELESIADYQGVNVIKKEMDTLILVHLGGIAKTIWKNQELIELYNYGENDGIQNGTINDVFLSSNFIYCATSNGICKVKRKNIFRSTLNKAVSINSIFINGEEVNLTLPLDLKNDQNDLRIIYHLNNYSSKGRITYHVKLEPIQNEWNKTNERYVRYSNLDDGAYSFRVMATDLESGLSTEAAELNFIINPHFSETWWFRILMTLILALFILKIFQFRQKKIEEKITLEQEMSRRLSILKLESLRSQMNPHFIFNAIGSIQYYIQINELDQADEYFTRFAHLIRKFLDSSAENLISIEKEIGLLKDYIFLEEMRFEYNFHSEFIIDKSINISDQKIPTMLIQPFVENAINHGLRLRTDKKASLRIQFHRLNQEEIECIISDNGIGIQNAESESKKHHQSRGLKNIFNRIDVLKKSKLAKVSVTTENLSNDVEYPGTKITLTYSINQDYEN